MKLNIEAINEQLNKVQSERNNLKFWHKHLETIADAKKLTVSIEKDNGERSHFAMDSEDEIYREIICLVSELIKRNKKASELALKEAVLSMPRTLIDDDDEECPF